MQRCFRACLNNSVISRRDIATYLGNKHKSNLVRTLPVLHGGLWSGTNCCLEMLDTCDNRLSDFGNIFAVWHVRED